MIKPHSPAARLPASEGALARSDRLGRLIDRLPGRVQRTMLWLLHPRARWARIPAGIFLVIGGLLSILPLLGLWMLPLGLVLLAEDVAILRRMRERTLDWVELRRPQWLHGKERT